MKIKIFTIRTKSDGKLLYAEGVLSDHQSANFTIDAHWLDGEDHPCEAWRIRDGRAMFMEEIRHLCGTVYKQLTFSIEQIDFQ